MKADMTRDASYDDDKPIADTLLLKLMGNKIKKYDPVVVQEFIKVAKCQVDYVHLFLNPGRIEDG